MGNSTVVLDFNDAPRQGEITQEQDYTVDQISEAVVSQIKNYVLFLFPNANINRGTARVGSLQGEPGESLSISLDGEDAGQWIDHNTGECGNAVQLWQQCDRLSFPDTITEVKKWLGFDSAPLRVSAEKTKRDSQPKAPPVQLGAPDNEYHYRDAAGSILATVRRYNLPDGKKTFRVWDAVAGKARQPDPKPLYNIPGIITAEEIVFVEGEKAADKLIELGYAATTLMSGGNSKLDKTDFTYIKGKNCVLWRDNDATGEQWEQNLQAHLKRFGCSVRALKPPQSLGEKGDAADCSDEEIKLAFEAPPVPSMEWIPANRMTYVTAGNWLIKGWIPATGLGCLYGDPGSGKTFNGADIGLHIATERQWHNERIRGGKVAYLAMESGSRFQNRVKAWCEHYEQPEPGNFLYSPISIDLRRDNKGAEQIIESLRRQGVKMLVIDTLSRALSGGNENSPEDMMAFVDNCDKIWKALDCFVLIIHHVGKDAAKGMRGHSSLLGAIDTELQLKDQTITVLKQRDGQDGLIKGFELAVKAIGKDEDGDDVTTCVAVPNEVENQKTKDEKPSPKQKDALDILHNLILGEGKKIQCPVGSGALVTVVHLEKWKDECRNHGVTDYEDSNKARSGFHKIKQALKKKGKIMFYEKYVWSTVPSVPKA